MIHHSIQNEGPRFHPELGDLLARVVIDISSQKDAIGLWSGMIYFAASLYKSESRLYRQRRMSHPVPYQPLPESDR